MKYTFLGFFTFLVLAQKAFGFADSIHPELTKKAAELSGFDPAAIEILIKANVTVDRPEGEWFVPEAHFDNESFKAGSERIKRKLNSSVKALIRCQREEALRQLGGVLHSVEDFFSHSNFVELESAKYPDFLKLKKPKQSLVCDAKTGSTGLTSGYYSFSEEEARSNNLPQLQIPEGKCTHDELAKDYEQWNRSDYKSFNGKVAQARELAIRFDVYTVGLLRTLIYDFDQRNYSALTQYLLVGTLTDWCQK